jgi:hypothetical protein
MANLINPEANPSSELPPTVDQTIQDAQKAAIAAFRASGLDTKTIQPKIEKTPNIIQRWLNRRNNPKNSQAPVPIKTAPESSPIKHTPRI